MILVLSREPETDKFFNFNLTKYSTSFHKDLYNPYIRFKFLF